MIKEETKARKKAYNKAYYLLRREKAKIYNKVYKLFHSSEIKVQKNTYYKTNKERLRTQHKNYYIENRDERLFKDKLFQQTPMGKETNRRHKANRRKLSFVPLK